MRIDSSCPAVAVGSRGWTHVPLCSKEHSPMPSTLGRVAVATLALVSLGLSLVAATPAGARTGYARSTHARTSTHTHVARASGPELLLSMNGKRSRRSPGVTGLKNDGRSNLRVGVAT